jgi:hypothetical protein
VTVVIWPIWTPHPRRLLHISSLSSQFKLYKDERNQAQKLYLVVLFSSLIRQTSHHFSP